MESQGGERVDFDRQRLECTILRLGPSPRPFWVLRRWPSSGARATMTAVAMGMPTRARGWILGLALGALLASTGAWAAPFRPAQVLRTSRPVGIRLAPAALSPRATAGLGALAASDRAKLERLFGAEGRGVSGGEDGAVSRVLEALDRPEVVRALEGILGRISVEELNDPVRLNEVLGAIYESAKASPADASLARPSVGRDGTGVRIAEAARLARASVSTAREPLRVPEPPSSRFESSLLDEAGVLRARLLAYAAEREALVGPEAFEEELLQDRVEISDPVLGRAELNTVDGLHFVRVAHAPTEWAVIFLPGGVVARDSRHLRQIIARQHIDAGRHRADKRMGRDLLIQWEKNGRLLSLEFLPKPAMWSREWWSDYWHATRKRPTSGDVVLGLLSGTAQGLLAYLLMLAKVAFGTAAAVQWEPIIFTFCFGVTIGSLSSAYINWMTRGRTDTWRGRASQMLKSALVSFIFAYSVKIFTLGLPALALTGWSAVALHGFIFLNVYLNTLGKVAWQQLSKISRDNRQFTKTLPFGVNPASAFYQALYLVNWTFRLADLIGVPMGKWLFVASIPAARYFVLRFVEKKGYPEAPALRELWESDKARLRRLLRAPFRWLSRGGGGD